MRHRPKPALRRFAVTLVLAVTGATTFGAMGGCDNEGEGERCTFFMGGDAAVNGTNECSSGLVCDTTVYYSTTMTPSGVSGMLGVCCPPDRSTSIAPACRPGFGGSTTVGAPTGDGSFDAGSDAVPTSGRDASGFDAKTGDAKTGDATLHGDASPDGG